MGGLTGNIKQQLQNQIDSAQAKLESKLGTFLTTNQTIRDARGRAQAQQNSTKPDVVSSAKALAAKADGLLKQYDNIKTNGMATADKLATLKTAFQTDSVLKLDNPLSMGTRVVELFNQKKSDIMNAVSSASQLAVNMQQHIDATNQLVQDVSNLEDYAAGKGIKATLTGIGSTYVNSFMAPAFKIAAVGAVIWLIAPSLLARTGKAVLRGGR